MSEAYINAAAMALKGKSFPVDPKSQGVIGSAYIQRANEIRMQQAQEEQRKAQEEQRKAQELSLLQERDPSLAEATQNPEELPVGQRVAMSMPSDIEGKAAYLAKKFGEENVSISEGENKEPVLIFRPSQQEKWRLADRPETTIGDVADLVGPAIEIVPSVAAGVLTSVRGPQIAIPVAGIVSAGSTAAREVAAEGVTGEDKPWTEIAKKAFVSGILGATGEGAVRAAASSMSRVLTPRGKADALVKKAAERTPSETREGLELSKEFDVPLTAGQITKSQKVMQIESLQRQVGSGVDVAVKAKLDRAAKVQEAGLNLAESIASGKTTSGPAATKALSSSRDLVLKNLKEARAKEAEELVSFVEPTAQMNMGPTVKMLDNLIERYSGKLQSKSGKALVGQLQEWKEMVRGRFTAKDLQLALEQFGEYGSTGDIMADISQKTGQKVGRIVLKSLYDSLETTAKGGEGISSQVQGSAAALKTFRDAYKKASGAMEEVDNQIMAKAAKISRGEGSPDALIKGIASGRAYDPEDIAKTLSIVDAVQPETGNQIRGAVIRRILTSPGKKTLGGNQIANRLGNRDASEMLEALFKNRPEQLAKIRRFAKVAEYSEMGPYREGAQTAPMLSLLKEGTKLGPIPVPLITRVRNVLNTSESITKLLQTKEGVDALFDLTKSPKSLTRKAGETTAGAITRTLARIVELLAEEEIDE